MQESETGTRQGPSRYLKMESSDKKYVRHGDLVLQGLTKKFGSFNAVDSINLTVRNGEFLTLLGPSGSGKTTLLMMIAGFVDPTAGQIILDGSDISNLPPEKRNFGIVFQGYALFPHMTVEENIAYPLEVRHQSRSMISERVKEMLDLVQLHGLGSRYPRQLSGGQQQRVALARSLAFGPRILLLDEPLGALDRKLRVEVQNELKDLHSRTGTTFIYVTHDQDEALSMSDRIAIMDRGQIIQLDGPTALYENPVSVFAANFLGKSNFVRTTIMDIDKTGMQFRTGDFLIRQKIRQSGLAIGNKATLAIRPEKIRILDPSKSDKFDNSTNAVIRRISYFGNVLEIELVAPSIGEITASVPAWQFQGSHSPGQSVTFGWDEDAAVIVRDDDAVGET